MKCSNCNTELEANAKFCGVCGAQINEGASASQAQPVIQTPPFQTQISPQQNPYEQVTPQQDFAANPTFAQTAKNTFDPLMQKNFFDKQNTDKMVNGMNNLVASIKYKFTSVKSDGPRVFTNHPYTQIGGAIAVLVYASILLGLVALGIYIWLSVDAFSLAGQLDASLKPVTSSIASYIGSYVDGYTSGVNTIQWLYFMLMSVGFARLTMGIVLCLYFVLHGIKLKNRSTDFASYFYKGICVFCVLGTLTYVAVLIVALTGIGSSLGSASDLTPIIVKLCCYAGGFILVFIVYSMYISSSIRLRTYMGCADYLKYNPFTKNNTPPNPLGMPMQMNQ